ncbi:hypothetical protein [Rhodanobacter denitrificans]|uniref:SMODS and SLOG-associating 2TM effector domain-containing protein n=1 Tax=Rhodanobacter denitrificans TaxID=666685 RepID=M4NM30_9GAMM|nr:hypothetical protein [Rhodanobacter denitrificans]AGG88791.1 hypothetical protein R2APBS1_1659 [Rhodanobacter denitrificans]UJJ58542.1 hypothetical protein LRK55_18245 [Rhodanobacter denitrificans]UJM87923.1 hypothetical protein LRJ86_06370 [Rhodanobacter denitrificans]
MNEKEFIAWADAKRKPLEMAIAKSLSITVAKHSKRVTKFVGWWLTAIGAAAGVLAANASQAPVILGARGFKVDFSILVLAGIMGLWSQYRGTQAQKALAITTSIAKNLPPILDDYRKVEKELAEADGCPEGYDTSFDIMRAMKLGLSMQPWPAKMMAAYGQRKATRSPHPELLPYSEAARLTFWQQFSAQGMVLMTLLFAIVSGYLVVFGGC